MLQKTTWMRFLIVCNSIAFILLSLISCVSDIDPVKSVSYLYKNNSDRDLIMEIYNSRNELIRTFDVPNGEEIVTNTTKNEVPAVFHFESFEDKIGNSVRIKFDDNKCLNYNKNNLDRIFDIVRYDNYSQDLIQKSEYTLIYIFKSKDYAKSQNCN